MQSDRKKMWKEAGILFAITLIAGLALGFVHELTKEPIAVQQQLKIQNSCKAVFADADHFTEETLQNYATDNGLEDVYRQLTEEGQEAGVKIGETFYVAMDLGGNCIGYVFSLTSTQGYGGNIELMAGYTNDGTVSGVSILSISETPGLGMRAGEVLIPQFEGQKVNAFTYTKSGKSAPGEIDAISGATITTKAVTGTVNIGLSLYKEMFEGKGEQ